MRYSVSLVFYNCLPPLLYFNKLSTTTIAMSNSDSPAILNISDFNDSFKSVTNDDSLVNIPMVGLDGPVISNNSKAGTFWKKWLDILTLLLIPVGCISAIIYLSFKVQWKANLNGNYSLSIPVLGYLNGSFELKEQN